MNTALESMLKDFTARRGSVQAMSDGEGRLMLVLSQALVVNFIEDAVSDEVRVVAQAGRLPTRLPREEDAHVYGEQWLTFPHEQNGFEWATAYNPESGNVVLTARERLSRLDSVSFDAWLDSFLQLLTRSAGVFTGRLMTLS
jgi:hypothetical protein